MSLQHEVHLYVELSDGACILFSVSMLMCDIMQHVNGCILSTAHKMQYTVLFAYDDVVLITVYNTNTCYVMSGIHNQLFGRFVWIPLQWPIAL